MNKGLGNLFAPETTKNRLYSVIRAFTIWGFEDEVLHPGLKKTN